MRLHALLLASLVPLVACSADPGPITGKDGKADDTDDICTGAAIDSHGFCRGPDGRFVPKMCCDPDAEVDCQAFEDQAFDNCVPDDEAPIDWRSCFELFEITEASAASCCEQDDFLWCSSLPLPAECSGTLSSPLGQSSEDMAESIAAGCSLTVNPGP